MDNFFLEIYLTRHGESEGNRAFAERENSNLEKEVREEVYETPLTPFGREQAALLGKRLSSVSFDAVFSSPLERAVETAFEMIIRQPERKKIELMPDVMEVGTHPGYEGKPFTYLLRKFPCLVKSENPTAAGGKAFLEKENPEEILKRAKRCIAYFRKRFSEGERIFVVGHGTYNNYFIRAALGLSNETDFNFCQENTALTKIRYFKDGRTRLCYSNDTSHLYQSMPDITFTL